MAIKNILTEKCGHFPRFVEFQINSNCNSKCTICPYNSSSKKFPQTVMSEDLINKIIREIDIHKENIDRVIPYLNNEPSLDNRMIAVLQRLKKCNHFIELSTNMSGFTKTKSDKIITEKLVDELRISFFGGTYEVYNKMMPGLNYYETISKMKYLIEANKSKNNPVNIKIVVILYPELDMEKNIRLIKNLFPDIEIYTFGYLDRASNVKNINNKKVLDVDENNKYILQGCNLNRPFERICILSNGKVVFCSQDWDREIELGNVLTQSIYDIWNGKLFETERARLIGEENSSTNYLCKRCKLVHLKEQHTGKISLNFYGDKYIDENDEMRTNIN